jgi:hypothetical protein
MSQPLAAFQVSSSIQYRFNTVFHSIPKILVFLFILVIGWFVATASIVLVALGVIAALHQAGIAAAATQPILYTVLLTCGAISAIGVGGGLVKPMQARWERTLTAAERETGGQLAAYQQGRADAMRAGQAHGQPAVRQPSYPGGPDYSQGPRYLQGPAFTGGPGYPRNPGFSPHGQGHKEDPGQSPETVILDDPDNYPGGQYM